MEDLSEIDAAELEKIRALVSLFADALFLTVAAGAAKATRSAYVKDRTKANDKWQELVDAVVEFAMKDER